MMPPNPNCRSPLHPQSDAVGLALVLIAAWSLLSLRATAKRSSFANFDTTIDARGHCSLLGADSIIDGTLSEGPGKRLTATLYLVETESGTNRAAAQVGWTSTDIPGLQQATLELATDALSKVLPVRFDVEVQPPEPVNQAAYRAYLEAKYQWSLRFGIWTFLGDAQRAIANFELNPKTPDIEYLWAEETAFLRDHADFPVLLDKLKLTDVIPQA